MRMGCVERTEGTLKQKQKAGKDKLRKANKAIKRAIKANPDNPRYHYWAGVMGTYNAISDAHSFWTIAGLPFKTNKAIDSYEKAVKLKPDFHQAKLELMGMYDRLPWYCGGNKSRAEKHAKMLEQMDAVYGAKARCEIRSRKSREEKIEIWEKIVTKDSNNAGAHAGLARELMHKGDLPASDMEQSVEHINKALELDPSRSLILLDLAWHYKRAKRFDKAEETLRRYVDFDPAPPIALRACAMRELSGIYQKQGKQENARKIENEAKELDPTEWPSIRHLPLEDLFVAP